MNKNKQGYSEGWTCLPTLLGFKASRPTLKSKKWIIFADLLSPRSLYENERKWQGFGFIMKLVSVLKALVQWIKVLAYLNHSNLTHEWLLEDHGNRAHQAHNWYGFLFNFLLKMVKVEFCQKWVFLLFTKNNKFYLKRLDYHANFLDNCVNLHNNTCTLSKPYKVYPHR